jgi:hypothetical protein
VDAPGTGRDGSDVAASGGVVTAVSGTPGSATPPSGAPTATADSRQRLRVVGLSIRRASRGWLVVEGRVSRALSRRLSLRVASRSGKRLLARGSASSRRGRFRARLRLRHQPGKGRLLLTVRYPGDQVTAPLTLKRRLPLTR